MPSLDDLRRVVRRIETRRPPRPAAPPVQEVLGGELHDTGAGQVLVVRREFPLSHRHGRYALGAAFEAPLDLLSAAARAAAPVGEARGLLFLDTETTGLAGGTGTYAFLVGAGWLEDERLVLAQYFMRDFDDEPALLTALVPLFERASGVVTFNGAGFDLPLLETRFVLARHRWPHDLPHLDLLRPSRRVWTGHFPDCRLGTLEREVLGLEREDDVPGALIPALYFDFLRSRRAAPLRRVFDHNRDDILSLVSLLGWFGRALVVQDDLEADELAGLGRLWEPADLDRALACYRAALAAGLAGPAAQRVRLRLARWEKRAARWDAACALWEAASRHEAFDPLPWEELAKFHEHRRRDLAAARAIVEEALDLAAAAGAPERTRDAFAYRLGRLERRLAPPGCGRA
ncbi:MAG: ribonuclease H-like domain-containing protein [Candidatus Rokubacteria bacterium]|nr:ribonuclease H-like domain-containing protein [Candidatus Rokubacteria bacterium]